PQDQAVHPVEQRPVLTRDLIHVPLNILVHGLHCPPACGDGMAPRAMALVTAAVRSLTPSLPNSRSRWVLTVASVMDSWRPISALVRPRATSASTSVSRLDSRSRRGCRTWLTRRRATDGASTVSPRAAARGAWPNSPIGDAPC